MAKKRGVQPMLVVTRNGGTLYIQAQLPLRLLNAVLTRAGETFIPPIVEPATPAFEARQRPRKRTQKRSR